MKLNEISDNPGARRPRKRVGRGIGSGLGKTSGRGVKGQKARSGVSINGYEGGQMPIHRRLPKRGFTNIHRKEYAIVNLEELNRFAAGSEVTPETLIESGLVKNPKDGIKILGDGELKVQLTVKANKFSRSAVEKIQAAGGKTEVI